jgi:hypothetical protein
MGRQLFALPLFWQVFDLNLVPDIKSVLVTHAYRTFFDRTVANFEALVEGRDIRIGRPVDEPALPPMELLMPLVYRICEVAVPVLQRLTRGAEPSMTGERRRTDADGFVHITPASAAEPGAATAMPEPDRLIAEVLRFLDGFRRAVQRDFSQYSQTV